MIKEERIIYLVEQQINNCLTEAEQMEIDIEISTQPALKALFEQYTLIIKTLAKKKNFRQTQALLKSIRQEQYQNKNKLNIKFLNTLNVYLKRHKTKLTIAASVMIVITATITIMFVNNKSQLIELSRHFNHKIASIEAKIDNTKKNTTNISTKANAENAGTGFLIDNNGYILTNAHLINNTKEIYVNNNLDKIVYKAKVIAQDKELDIALLKILDSNYYHAKRIPYGFTNHHKILGEQLFTLGFPKEDIVYSAGYLSSLSGYNNDTTTFQLAIDVNPGNSGGPIFNTNGNIIGVLKNKHKEMNNVNFAIKSEYIIDALKQMKKNYKQELHDLNINTIYTEQEQKRLPYIKKIESFIFTIKTFA